MTRFIGREKELSMLNQLLKKQAVSLVVIRGRRRIGKTRLIREFIKDKRSVVLTGLPPVEATTAQSQRDEFKKQIHRVIHRSIPPQSASAQSASAQSAFDWFDLFKELADHTAHGRVVIVLDEISWVGSKDPDFLGKLKHAWDLHFSNNPQLMLIVCGSVSSWIDRNILSATGFVGRVSIDLWVKELSIIESKQFWDGKQIAPREILEFLTVVGGVPKYLEEMVPEQSSEVNIRRLL